MNTDNIDDAYKNLIQKSSTESELNCLLDEKYGFKMSVGGNFVYKYYEFKDGTPMGICITIFKEADYFTASLSINESDTPALTATSDDPVNAYTQLRGRIALLTKLFQQACYK